MGELFLDGSKLIHHLDRVHDWKEGKRIAPIHVEISPTSGCNQRCKLCYVDYLGHKSKFLDRSVMLKALQDFENIGVKSVLLAGEGEPTLNQAIVPFIKKTTEHNIDVALNSNAVMLDESMAKEVLPHLTWLRFTFQSSNPSVYREVHRGGKKDFEKALSNVQKCVALKKDKELKVTLGIQQILINENYSEVYANAKMAKELGVDYFVVKRFSKHESNSYDVPDELWRDSIDELKKAETLSDSDFKVIVRWRNFSEDCHRVYKRCIGLPFISQILADGHVYPCAQFFHQKNYSMGNLYDSNYKEIIYGERAQEVFKSIECSINVQNCMSYCRHHSTNQFLWPLLDRPAHVNFI